MFLVIIVVGLVIFGAVFSSSHGQSHKNYSRHSAYSDKSNHTDYRRRADKAFSPYALDPLDKADLELLMSDSDLQQDYKDEYEQGHYEDYDEYEDFTDYDGKSDDMADDDNVF